MGLLIKNIEPEAVLKNINSFEAQTVVGGKSQYASLQGVASTPNGSASFSITGLNEGDNPYLNVEFNAQVVETEESIVSSSSAFISAGNY
ncbi:MAG: hypothetical protein KME09_13320 [Pleurocapsa minor HA4230-MV1]|jgi:hypothetical protein|nr:hypothetical protein [Pleurocapsa minor HA4230-MV1]